MSTSARICTVMFGSLPFSMAWEVIIHAGSHAASGDNPPTWMVLAGGFPQLAAAVLVVAILADRPKPQQQDSPAFGYLPPAQTRRAIQHSRKELAR